MSKSVFASSKSALVFAGMIIVSTLAIVGTGEGGGVLDQTVDRLAQQRETIAEEARTVSEERTEVIEPLDPDAGWGGTGDPVFGEFQPGEASEPIAPEDPSSGSSSVARQAGRTSTAPASIGGPVKADSLGVPVERNVAGGLPDAPPPEPVVTSRTLKIEPQ